jgi:hypothetical protein
MVEIRPFARHDREQLTALVNAHIGTVTPGGSIPSATLLNQMERPLGEYIIGPWVTDLATFVAVERDRVVGATHLRRYVDGERVSACYRDAGEIVWLLCWPGDLAAGRAVRDAALAQLTAWGVRVWYGDGTLPAPGAGRGIGTWLVGNATAWLRLAGITRVMTYAIENDYIDRCTRYYARYGLRPINRTVRGWRRMLVV